MPWCQRHKCYNACLASIGGVSLTLCTAHIISVTHTHWQCYFSLQFTLGLKASVSIVTLARAPWHILKWPAALDLVPLTPDFLLLLKLRSFGFAPQRLFLAFYTIFLVTVPAAYPATPPLWLIQSSLLLCFCPSDDICDFYGRWK